MIDHIAYHANQNRDIGMAALKRMRSKKNKDLR